MKMIFILGFPRTGSTILQVILNSSKSIVSYPETHFFPILAKSGFQSAEDKIDILRYTNIYQKYHGKKPSKDLIENLSSLNSYKDSNFVKETLKRSYKLFLNSTFRGVEFSKLNIQQTFLDKTPGNINHIELIRFVFPESKMLYTLRNPRFAIQSYLLNFQKSNIYELSKRMTDSYTYYTQLRRQSPENTLLVKHENLLADYSNTIIEVCSFLQIDFIPQCKIDFQSKENLLQRKERWKHANLGNNMIERSNNKYTLNKYELAVLDHELRSLLKFHYGFKFNLIYRHFLRFTNYILKSWLKTAH